jgi:hypothetical protein
MATTWEIGPRLEKLQINNVMFIHDLGLSKLLY